MGFLGFMYRQRIHHAPENPPQDLTGKTILITGGNAGIGLAAAKRFAGFKASRIILVVRDPAKGKVAGLEIRERNPQCMIDVWQADMESFESVLNLGKRVQEQVDRLDIAVLNAGVKKTEHEICKPTGHEANVQVNYYSPALLSLLLLKPLRETAAKTGEPSRLTFTSSEVHMWSKFEERGNLIMLQEPKSFKNPDRYNTSKLLNVFWLRKLANKVDSKEIIVNCFNPGLVKSALHRENSSVLESKFIDFFGWTVDEGARCLIDAAVVKKDESHGGYISECRPSK